MSTSHKSANIQMWPETAIAIVGVGLRLPGGLSSLDELWQALVNGADMVTEAPVDRFDRACFVNQAGLSAGKSYTAAGGFLGDIAGFDADYFGISPKEASRVDPQHRLLLECAAEAFDDASIDPATLAGSDTAVFIGISTHDYNDLQLQRPHTYNTYNMAGSASSNSANRLSYFFDLHGQSAAVDTACSSALTAMHDACATLRSGRSAVALAGGVNILLSPVGYIGASHASMLSPTGRCHPFSALADGFVRAEGAGVFVLKPLKAAVADGDRVHAVIAGSGVNCDGHTAGLSMPSAATQADLLEQVYATAGIDPSEIAYVEAHGTGTQAGDPVECEALGRALGLRRDGPPIPIGSVKSNVGHLEAAAGVAGVCKALLVLREGQIPRTLHSEPVNPAIDFAGLGLEPVTRPRRLNPLGRHCVVGVNSFGFGGANAHLVLGGFESEARSAPRRAGLRPVLVSAETAAAVTHAASRLADHLSGTAADDFEDVAFTTCRPRARHRHQFAVLASNAQEAATRLRGLAAQETVDQGASARAVDRGAVGFVFSGNGATWVGMAAELLREDAVFTAEMTSIDQILLRLLGWSVRAELAEPRDPARWDRADVAQPLLFAVQAGLVATLVARGIRPAAVAGHSVGEIAAAYCAGALDRADACRVIAERSRAQAATHGDGRMAAVGLSALDAEERLRASATAEDLVIAAINSERDVTVSGDSEALAQWGAELQKDGVFFRDLVLPYAFHSSAMDGLRGILADRLAGLTPAAARVPVFSTVTGSALSAPVNAEYWWRNVRAPVRFADAITEMITSGGCDVLLEVGPHPVLSGYLRRIAATPEHLVEVVPTLMRSNSGPDAVDAALVRLLAVGTTFDRSVYFPDGGRVVSLPAYPWQRDVHWSGHADWWLTRGADDAPTEPRHPLLGQRQMAVDPEWQQLIGPVRLGWLADHKVGDSVVMPVAGFIDMALSASGRTWNGPVEAMRLVVNAPLVLPFGNPTTDVHACTRISSDSGRIAIAARFEGQGNWTEHVRARVRQLRRPQPSAVDLDSLRCRMPKEVNAADHYRQCARLGLLYGPAFQTLKHIRMGDGELLASYRLDNPPDPSHYAHPAALDGALQSAMQLLEEQADPVPFLPVGVDVVRCWQPMPQAGEIHTRSRTPAAMSGTELLVDITITDSDGTVALELLGVRMRRFSGGAAAPVQHLSEVLRASPLADWPATRSPLPSPESALVRCGDALSTLTDRWHSHGYRRLRPRVLEMTAHFTAAAIRTLLPDRDCFTIDDLIAAGAKPRHARFLTVMLEHAAEQGVVRSAGEGAWRHVIRPVPERLFTRALLDFPADSMQLLGYGVSGRHLADVLTGRQDPLELLFSDADAVAARFYDSNAITKYHNAIAALLLQTTVAGWPSDRPLRVLEVGAGTGATTEWLLPKLPASRTHYTYTDISPAFFDAARHRLREFDFLHFQALDLDADPTDQGFTSGSYDIVIAGYVLHAARDLSATLNRIADLLSANGQLLAIEPTNERPMIPLFGMLDSFWGATDTDRRPHSPLLQGEQWSNLLEQCGFRNVVQVGDTEEPVRGDCSVILAARTACNENPGQYTQALEERSWLIVQPEEYGDRATGFADAITARLTDCADKQIRQMIASESPDIWDATLSESATPVDIVLLLDGNDAAETNPVASTEQAVRYCAYLRALAVATRRKSRAGQPRLWLVVGTDDPAAHALPPASGASAAAWGVARSLANEVPGLAVRRIGLSQPTDPPACIDKLVAALVAEFAAQTDEDEVLLTANGRFVSRLLPVQTPSQSESGPAAGRYVLACTDMGQRYNLEWLPTSIPEPGPGDVTIAVQAAGLNYRDVMVATGLVSPFQEIYRQRPGLIPLGFECAGTVAATGSEVHEFAVGDLAFAPAYYSLGSHIVMRADRVFRVPDGMSCTEAATLPVVFITVQHCLDHLARLAPGETLLVHGAAGGVGLAAWQYARAIGATVIATAGTPAKRDLLQLLGIKHVLNSRSLDFADQILGLTEGHGVDVVLNSLVGEAATRSLDILKPHGRFIELGKRDILADNTLPMAAFSADRAYFVADFADMIVAASPRMDAYRDAIARRIHDGDYRPLPHRTYPASRVSEAFAFLQHSRHVGKVVVTFDDPPPVRHPATETKLGSDATYLITGGLSGFGAATAIHLTEQGARHLVLCSRRGEQAPEAHELLAMLRANGVSVTAYAADVTDHDAMHHVLEAIDGSGYPLAGVIHAAMVLDDAPLAELSNDRLRRVLAPKMTGGHVLDQLTRTRELDFFIVYTSVSTAIGNIQQAPYVAGNMALDTLIRDRRANGLPGLSIQWGVITDSGYVARTNIAGQLETFGLGGMTTRNAMSVLEKFMFDPNIDVVTAINTDSGRLASTIPTLGAPRLGYLAAGSEATAKTRQARIDLAGLTPEDAAARIEQALAEQLARIMQTTPSKIDRSRRLDLVGVDSLMAAELATLIRQSFDCQLSGLEISSAPHLTAIAQLIQDKMPGKGKTVRATKD